VKYTDKSKFLVCVGAILLCHWKDKPRKTMKELDREPKQDIDIRKIHFETAVSCILQNDGQERRSMKKIS